MGFRAVDWAIEQRIKAGPKLTLICIASFADDQGVAWPGEEELAAMISDTEEDEDEQDEDKRTVACLRTVNRHVKYLADKGLITITKRRSSKGYLRNEYQLIAEAGRFSYRKPYAKMAHGQDEAIRQNGVQPYAKMAHTYTPNWRINQSVEPVNVNQTLPNGRVGDAATPPAPARTKTTASKSPQTPEEVALQADCNHVFDAIVAEHVLTKGDRIQLRQTIKPFVMRYGADDVIAWHRAACRAKDGNYVPISYASRGINGWIAAGRPEIEPNPFAPRRIANGRDAAPSAVVAASKKYGDNEHYAQLEREHNEWLRSLGEAV